MEDRFAVYDFEAVRFVQVEEVNDNVPGAPRAAFSLHTGESLEALPEPCPSLTNHTFLKHATLTLLRRVKIALGFTCNEARRRIYYEMAMRMAGEAFCQGQLQHTGDDCVSILPVKDAFRFFIGKLVSILQAFLRVGTSTTGVTRRHVYWL